MDIGSLHASVPVIQGGMGVGISLSGLASAVADQGGIGVIASVGIGENEDDIKTNYKEANKRALIREIQKAREKSSGIIGVNIMVALSDCDTLVEGAVEAGADLVLIGAGLPLKLPATLPLDDLESLPTRLVPIVSSPKAVNIICKNWYKRYNYTPDAIIVEGPMAGGHLGFRKEQIDDPEYALERLVEGVLDAVEPYQQQSGKHVSVIAAGGVYTGEDIFKFIQMGADGVQMATRFVATEECDAAQGFKDAHINCSEEDLVIITSPVGLPGRAINNEFLEKVASGKTIPYSCPWKCLKTCDVVNSPYCIAKALLKAKMGVFDQGFAFAGSNAYRSKKIVSVRELIRDLKQEYAQAASLSLSPQ